MKLKTLLLTVLLTTSLIGTTSADYAFGNNDASRIAEDAWQKIASEIFNDSRIEEKDIYTDSFVKIEFVEGHLKKFYSSINTVIKLKVTVLSPTKVIKPWTHVYFGFEYGSLIGGTTTRDILIYDDFKNTFDIINMSPEYTGGKEKGIKPGESKEFTIEINDYPIKAAEFIKISIGARVFGNTKGVILKIPIKKIQLGNLSDL
jgi:hypothetical protein